MSGLKPGGVLPATFCADCGLPLCPACGECMRVDDLRSGKRGFVVICTCGYSGVLRLGNG